MSEDIILDDYEYIDGYLDESVLMYQDMDEARRVTKQQLCLWYLKYRILKFLCIV
jgi:hypothetical protein